MAKTHWIEVFKTGEHTDAGGNTQMWTVDDLDTIVQLYNEQDEATKHTAPFVIGHPVDDSPAYGWVLSVKREGESLYAELRDVDEGVKTAVNDGRYEKISIALYENKLLRHVGDVYKRQLYWRTRCS